MDWHTPEDRNMIENLEKKVREQGNDIISQKREFNDLETRIVSLELDKKVVIVIAALLGISGVALFGVVGNLWSKASDALTKANNAAVLADGVVGELGEIQFTADSAIPVGGIVAVWGDEEYIKSLTNYEICDGTDIVHPDSKIKGLPKPNLVGRFPKGVLYKAKVKDYLFDGFEKFPKLSTVPYEMSIKEMPKHTHTIQHSQIRQTGDIYQHGNNHKALDRGAENLVADHTGNGDPFTLDIEYIDYAPAYQEVVFMIRVY